ncbi:hypothetical protein ACWD25_29970, partial [Streptomyces sp. NPDC002920]
DGAAEGYNFVFDGGRVSNDTNIRLPAAAPGEGPELIGSDFVALDQLATFVAPHTERRILQAVAALEEGRHGVYLVEGRAVTAG